MHRLNLSWTLLVLGVATAARAQEATKLRTTEGTYVRLREAFRSRPSVLFYEDKDSTRLNQALKDALFAAGKKNNLLDAVSVVAVANVQAYDWFPARNFVVSAVKETEKKVGVPVYLDWTGELTRKPWSLSANNSTVVIVDRAGAVRWTKEGKLEPKEVDEALALIGALLTP